MRLDRALIAVPLVGGLLVTGTAFAHGVGISPTVRDTVYPGHSQNTCRQNGVHTNKQGHANCGLHKGWSQDEGAAGGAPSGTDTPSSAASSSAPAGGDEAGHSAVKGGRSADHRPSGTHGKSGAHGRPTSPGKSGSHRPSGTHGSPTTRGHGQGGGKGHAKHGG
jgi:hypothetical protein